MWIAIICLKICKHMSCTKMWYNKGKDKMNKPSKQTNQCTADHYCHVIVTYLDKIRISQLMVACRNVNFLQRERSERDDECNSTEHVLSTAHDAQFHAACAVTSLNLNSAEIFQLPCHIQTLCEVLYLAFSKRRHKKKNLSSHFSVSQLIFQQAHSSQY